MKIAIDISQVIYGTGVSVYTKNLVTNLLKVDQENEYVLFGGSLRRMGDLKKFTNGLRGKFSTKVLPFPPLFADLIWNKAHLLPIEALVGRVDVFHSSDWTQPPAKAFKVTTIHDLTPIIYPKVAKDDVLRNIPKTHTDRLSWVKKEVDIVIAVSESTKEDIVNYLKIPQEKIRVIYEAYDPLFRPRDNAQIIEVKRKFRILGKYLLAVGTDPRKNLDRTTRAYELVKPEFEELKLVVVGRGKIDHVRGSIYVENITDEELAALYTGAEALVYPSLYEGFGLPIVQAFACGTPVVTSNVSSMPEVAGAAAILVDPQSVESIAEGIKKAVKNRKELIQKGSQRSKDFSWEKTARETLKVYNEARSSNV